MTTMAEVNEYLQHHGVKGMRWGVKKSSSRRSGGKTTYQKKPDRLSDAELSRRIKRMELEKKYSELNAPSKSSGKKFAQGLIQNQGNRLAATATTAVIGFAVKAAMKQSRKKNVLSTLAKMG